MEEIEASPVELPALTDPSKIAELVNRLYHQLPGQIASGVAIHYAEVLIRAAAAQGANEWNGPGVHTAYEI